MPKFWECRDSGSKTSSEKVSWEKETFRRFSIAYALLWRPQKYYICARSKADIKDQSFYTRRNAAGGRWKCKKRWMSRLHYHHVTTPTLLTPLLCIGKLTCTYVSYLISLLAPSVSGSGSKCARSGTDPSLFLPCCYTWPAKHSITLPLLPFPHSHLSLPKC